MTITAACEDLEELRKVVTIAERACQVVNTLKIGAPVSITVRQL
jgi:hypothetical protein